MSTALSLLANWPARAWLNAWPKQIPPRSSTARRLPIDPSMATDACTPVQTRVRPSRPLRVLRVVDAHPSRTGAGRMVISGRMADVCAELDRLAAAEAAYRLPA